LGSQAQEPQASLSCHKSGFPLLRSCGRRATRLWPPAGVTEPLRTSALPGAILRLWSAQTMPEDTPIKPDESPVAGAISLGPRTLFGAAEIGIAQASVSDLRTVREALLEPRPPPPHGRPLERACLTKPAACRAPGSRWPCTPALFFPRFRLRRSRHVACVTEPP